MQQRPLVSNGCCVVGGTWTFLLHFTLFMKPGFSRKVNDERFNVVFVQASAACYKCAARMGKMSNWLHVVGH